MSSGFIDLHVHSNCSDGTLSPKELVDYAIQKGVKAFALTDHDTVSGLEEAISYAEYLKNDLSSQNDMQKQTAAGFNPAAYCIPEVIPGIEFSTEYQERDIHILGLYIDYKKEAFTEKLQTFVDSRILRNRKMCALLREGGIDISYEQLLAEFPDAVITRAHYARFLLNHGYIKSITEAFERYVGDRCPYFVPREKVTPQEAVRLILEADGIPVLAHPILYRMSDSRLDELTASLKQAGLMGIEAIYSTYTLGEERQMKSLAGKYGLLITGGSDFHGANKPKIDLGTGTGRLCVPEEVLEQLRRRAQGNG